MGPTSRGSSSGSSHHTIKLTQPSKPFSQPNGHHPSNSTTTSSSTTSAASTSSHPLTDSGKRPRSTSTLGLSSPRMTRLRLRLHALSSSTPLRHLRLFTSSRRGRIISLFLLCLFTTLFLLPSTLNFYSKLRLPTSPLDPQASAAFSLTKPRLDQSGNEIPDESEGQQQVEIQRSFEEPDFSLLSSAQPHEIGCEVPIIWDPSVSNVSDTGSGRRTGDSSGSASTPASSSNPGVLVFLGVFSAAQSGDKSPQEMRRRRDLYRTTYFPHFPPNLVTAKFILGLPPQAGMRNPAAAIARAKVMRMIEEERDMYGDMVILDMEDNIDSGKTHRYFQWVAKEYAGEGQVRGRPRFVVKSDDDTLLVMPNLISAFRELDCSTNVYWGTSAGRSQYFGDYFRGLAYAMSWPLISWIGQADMPMAHITKIEDARTGQWLRHLDPVEDPITRIDYGWTMGDWNQLDVGLETVALHWCKWDDWVTEQNDRIHKIWKDAGRPFRWDRGIEASISVAKGKVTPEEARREHDRQIQAGWDVEGNLKGDAGQG